MNQHQLTVLKQGVKTWNHWRKVHPHESIDFSGFDFSNREMVGEILWNHQRNAADLPGINFSNVNLSQSNLEGADFSKANLQNANLTDANLWDSRFVNADLSYANITGAFMIDADLTNAMVYGIVYSTKLMRGKCFRVNVSLCIGDQNFKADALDQAYIDAQKKKMPKYIYWAWGFFTDYGRSLRRTSLLAIVCILLFAAIFYLDYFYFHSLIEFKSRLGLLTPLYHSFAIFLALGSDAVPKSSLGEFVIMAELVSGYLTLGLVLTVIARNLLPRA